MMFRDDACNKYNFEKFNKTIRFDQDFNRIVIYNKIQ